MSRASAPVFTIEGARVSCCLELSCGRIHKASEASNIQIARLLQRSLRSARQELSLRLEFERSHQGALGQFFCNADIVGDPGNGGDGPCGLDLPHGLNSIRHIFHAARLRRSGIH